MKTGIVTQIMLVQRYSSELDLVEVTLDHVDSYKAFGSFNEFNKYINMYVSFTVRPDVINGITESVICDISVNSIVQTVGGDALTEDMHIIANTEKSISVVDFDSESLQSGDTDLEKTILVSSVKDGKSKKASWKDFTCIDKNNKVFSLRLFSNMHPEELTEVCNKFVGRYVMTSIQNTQYGLQVLGDITLLEQEVLVQPEVILSRQALTIAISSDTELEQYVSKFDMLNYLKNTMHYELGYHLVEMYAELTLINACCKIYAKYDRKLLKRAVFASRGYLLGSKVKLSNVVVNYHRLLMSPLQGDSELIKLVDFISPAEEGDLNKELYLSIRRQVTSIMKDRRGLNEKNSISSVINGIDFEYAGLLSKGLGEVD